MGGRREGERTRDALRDSVGDRGVLEGAESEDSGNDWMALRTRLSSELAIGVVSSASPDEADFKKGHK